MKRSLFAALLLGVLLAFQPVLAREASTVGADPVLQARMMRLATVLRCLVCQNQTIADSHAELAQDLRNQILEQMQQGRTDQEIMDYMVARYGDFVLYRPPVKATTALLWFGPFILVLFGGYAFYRAAQQRNASTLDDQPLTPEEQAMADRLLAEDNKESA